MVNAFFGLLILSVTVNCIVKKLKTTSDSLDPQVIFCGAPHYIAGMTNGSPLSELGSHCGFKAVVEEKKAVYSALYSTLTSCSAGRLQEFAVSLTSGDGELFFSPAAKRDIHFHPFAIEEAAEDRGWKLHTKLFFVKTNIAVLHVKVTSVINEGMVRPEFRLISSHRRNRENPYPHLSGRRCYSEQEKGLLLTSRQRLPGRQLHAFFLPSHGNSDTKNGVLKGDNVNLAPGEELTWSVIVSFSADCKNKAVEKALVVRKNLALLTDKAKQRWRRFEEQLPIPHSGEEKFKDVFRLSAWALNNNLYAPRNRMHRWATLPCKVYFPFIWGWDTPQQAMGISEWSPAKAAQSLFNQLEANFSHKKECTRGQVPSKLSDSLCGVFNFYSQSPLQSWSALTVSERMSSRKKATIFLKQINPLLKGNISWWEKNRQHAGGLFYYLNGMESGLDDSPRFYPRRFVPSFIAGVLPRNIRAVDLNCWLFQSYVNAAFIGREAGRPEAVNELYARGTALAEKIDRELWCEEEQAWLDRRPDGAFVRELTPVIWWPAFVGATRNIDRIKAVIENHMLNEKEFWGQHGIPSVAFSSSAYNHRQDGYYWRGQIWLINTYSALEVLFRYGYTEEAEELRTRILTTMAGAGGIYETYNALTGERGWSSRGPGDPAAFQFGMSSAWAMQILLSRYQQFRYIFSDTHHIEGYIRSADVFDKIGETSPPGLGRQSVALFYVESHGQGTPHIRLESADGKPLRESALVDVRCMDPYRNLTSGSVVLYWQGNRYHVNVGERRRLELSAAVNY